MKRILFLLVSISTFQTALGQLKPPKTNAYFASAMAGLGTHISWGAMVQHQNKRGYTAAISLTVASRTANTPADYNCYICFPGEGPGNHLRTISALGGKVWQPRLQLFRYEVSAGIAVGTFSKSKNFEKKTPYSRYTYEQEKKFVGGLVMRSTVQLTLLPFFGYYVGAKANINPYDPSLTFEIGMTLGYLRLPINYTNYHIPAVP